MYRTVPNDLDDLKNKLIILCLEIVEESMQSLYECFLRRIQMCIHANGNLFEHLIYFFTQLE